MLHQLSIYIAVALLAVGLFYCLHIGAGVLTTDGRSGQQVLLHH